MAATFILLEMTTFMLVLRPSRLNGTQHSQSVSRRIRLCQLLRNLDLVCVRIIYEVKKKFITHNVVDKLVDQL